MRLPALFVLASLLLSSTATAGGAQPAVGKQVMVATEQRYATQVGVNVLRAGGNAIDAAVAVGYALAVVDPCCGNIGGGGFMLIRKYDGTERFIDFREKAPMRASSGMFLDRNGNVVPNRSLKGWLAVGVPGTVLGLETARSQYGTMSRQRLIAPAIALAKNGFTIEEGDLIPFRGALDEAYNGVNYNLQSNARAIFLPNGTFPRVNYGFKQAQLARTLAEISAKGPDAFYRGSIARAIVSASEANGGVLSMRDFADYTVEQSAPLHCTYRGYRVTTAPPPSSGGVTLCETLNVISAYPLGQWGWHSLKSTHYVTEAERRAYADRNTYLGDPDFVNDPVAQLLAPEYAAKLRSTILPDRATPSAQVRPGLGQIAFDRDQTTHYSIVDRHGNAVAVTYTLNDWFGAAVIAGDTGFFLNDEMDDFTAKPGTPNKYGLVQGSKNAIAPGKRPLSSMAPTIVTHGGALSFVTGSPGGSRIPTTVLETMLNVLDYKMNVQAAVNAPRTHMQWLPDQLQYEPNALSPAVMSKLRAMGYTLREIERWGSAQAVYVTNAGMRYGGSDRRRPSGAAIGY